MDKSYFYVNTSDVQKAVMKKLMDSGISYTVIQAK